MTAMKTAALLIAITALAGPALAKLPAPVMTEEAKAKAAENAAKAAHSGKVEAYLLCQSQERVAARYFGEARSAGKSVPTAAETAPCANPGPFVYTPAAAPAPPK
jgi:hypothetical protein